VSAERVGVKIIGSGHALPAQVVTNADLERLMDTSDEWIVQRTGIRTRHRVDPSSGECIVTLATEALNLALADARLKGADLDLVILASCTQEMLCPASANRVAAAVGATPAGSFDLVAGCSGFVFGLNVAESLVRRGPYQTVGLIGCDTLSNVADYTNRSVSILCGDAAGAVVLRRSDDPSVGCLYQSMYSDGGLWDYLYIPRSEHDVPPDVDWNDVKLGKLQMKGREVFKLAVSKLPDVLEEAVAGAGIRVDDLSMIVAHQSNARIIEAARRRLNLSEDHVYVNIDRIGNTSAASVPLCFDELRRAGRVRDGDVVAFISMGGGMTWGASIWRL
jgi:3-oxoacyl-[acyl-carrier-protein] synthase III